jgi:hypothetical protein
VSTRAFAIHGFMVQAPSLSHRTATVVKVLLSE